MYQSIYFGKYKSFSEKNENALEGLKNVNVIIGKNNSGKSSVLDVIGFAYDAKQYNKQILIEVDVLINNQIMQKIDDDIPVPAGYSWDEWQDHWHKEYEGKQLRLILNVDRENTWSPSCSKKQLDAELDQDLDNKYMGPILQKIEKVAIPDNVAFRFRRLSAERDIIPEVESNQEDINWKGRGASNIIQRFINHRDYDENLIEKTLLKALNEIMHPESNFEEIRIQQDGYVGNQEWEIYLKEKDCDRFALSQSGSGLKTIILLLLNLLVIPQMKDFKNETITYGFEELENNLHPAIQRKVFDYVYKYAIEKDICIFLTTHSHIAIDSFSGKENVSIYHVVKNNNISTIKKIENYVGKVEVLDDLNVKASDLLQSNGIIWVEGPSDRIYIKRWLEVFCNCKFEEGVHYQFMYYGGRLLSHFTAEETVGLINLLTTNRNAAIIMDSDKRTEEDLINETKLRIIGEFKKFNMFSWTTEGKEIENYIPAKAISSRFGNAPKTQCGKYELFPDYIKKCRSTFGNEKVWFANAVKEQITAENSKSILDLEKQIKTLYTQIENWNK